MHSSSHDSRASGKAPRGAGADSGSEVTDLLICDAAVVTMNPAGEVHHPGWIEIQGDRIATVAAGDPGRERRARARKVIEAASLAAIPGLVNAHTHLSQTFMRGLGDDKPLLRWLKEVMWPMQQAMTREDMRLAALLGLVENLHCGVTGVIQHHKLPDPAYADATLAAAEEIGLRLQLARGWVDLGAHAESQRDIVAELKRLFEQWHGGAEGRITIANGPMAPWRCSDETMKATAALARRFDATTHIHAAETEEEIRLLQERTGRRHVEWLRELGLLGPDMQLVHAIHLDERELDWIAESRAAVVHCPTSNMFLGSGIAPIPALLERGVLVGLGTDGAASHNSQDMLETMKTAALLAKIGRGDPTAISAEQVLHMATTAGGRLLGRDDLGVIARGAKADIALVRWRHARAMPMHRVVSALVYNCNGPDVDTVIVDGRVLLERGKTTMLDEDALLDECQAAAQALLDRRGMV